MEEAIDPARYVTKNSFEVRLMHSRLSIVSEAVPLLRGLSDRTWLVVWAGRSSDKVCSIHESLLRRILVRGLALLL